MGGLSSGTTASTRRIYVESASFDPVTVRKTSQRLGIRTDSSLRFEKGVDTHLPHLAQTRYAELLTNFIADAKVGGQTIITTESKPVNVTITHEMLVGKIGAEVAEKSITDILTRLGFEVSLKNTLYTIKVPSWRATGDVSITEDIIEEVSRHIGYETIPSLPLPGPL